MIDADASLLEGTSLLEGAREPRVRVRVRVRMRVRMRVRVRVRVR